MNTIANTKIGMAVWNIASHPCWAFFAHMPLRWSIQQCGAFYPGDGKSTFTLFI